jgi:hypothetical protein
LLGWHENVGVYQLGRATAMKTPTASARGGFFTRIKRTSLASLFALLAGGAILVFVGADALASTELYGIVAARQRIDFAVGSQPSTQSWTAILGVGFGLLSSGLTESYQHLFDYWCSLQATKASGLNYGRYLNTHERSPVVYGVRAFQVSSPSNERW